MAGLLWEFPLKKNKVLGESGAQARERVSFRRKANSRVIKNSKNNITNSSRKESSAI